MYTIGSISSIFIVILTFVTVNGDCPNGWQQHGQSCYWVSHDRESWIGALKVCGLFKAYLTEIVDDAENIFVFNLTTTVKDSFWIGGTDLDIEGEWKWWKSQTDLSYTAWAPNEPSNSGFSENCMELAAHGWNDKPCSWTNHYVCEMPVLSSQSILGRR